ncbi:MAG: SBBP repeat-containing protein [Acidobacteria bacterium]|nr:SBBP repeat-containing protein [Acidobacteriota bacterium]
MNVLGFLLEWSRTVEWARVLLRVFWASLLILTVGVLSVRPAVSLRHAAESNAMGRYGSLPLVFELNRGQADPSVKFLARGNASTAFLNARSILIALRRSKASVNDVFAPRELPSFTRSRVITCTAFVRVGLVGASALSRAEGIDPLAGKSNYFIGNDPAKWIKNVPTYAKVEFPGVYPGIDAVYYGNRRKLEFDFIVFPGANPRAIRLKIIGKTTRASLHVDQTGDLVVHTAAGDIRFQKPRAYQMEGTLQSGAKRLVQSRYVVEKDGTVSFNVGDYDRTKSLTIDPVLSYSTYLGGNDLNYASGIAVDGSGETYITGYTSSTDFPVEGGVQDNFSGGSCDTDVNTSPCFDAFVAKLNPQGSGLLYSTYLGGTGDDRGIRIAVDAAGEAYVAGFTDSLDFPAASAFQGSPGGGSCGTTAYPCPCFDAFVAKLSASGSNLIYASYLGGTGDDFASDIAVDSGGNAYVAGFTSAANFPTTHGALQTSFGGGPFDGFITKIGPAGTALVYSTYLGGSGEDHVAAIALDASGNAYLTGQTNSANFPTEGAFQPSYTATTCGSALNSFPCFEAFVSKLNPAGTALIYSSYLGGTAASYGNGIGLDTSWNAYVTGWTTSKDFPVTPSAYETAYNGSDEAFVAKVTPAGDALAYATYLGGSNPDVANAVAVDATGNAYIVGYAYGGGFPVVLPLQMNSGGFYDAIVTELNAAGSDLISSTYLGGTGDDYANDVALDASGNLYVAGDTFSADFPTTPSVFTTAYTGGSYDAWIAKISSQNAPGLTAGPNPLVFSGQEVNTTSAPLVLKLGDAGSAPLGISNIVVAGDFAQKNNCGGTVAAGTACSMSVTFTPSAAGVRTGTVTFTDTAAGSPQTVKLTGYGTSGAVSLSANSLDFGSVTIGTTSATQSVTLTNVAQSPLDISNIQAEGEYSESNTCGSVVNPGSGCTITITFSPTSTGTIVGSVMITDSATDSPQTIVLTGSGALPFTLTAQPASVSVLEGTDQVEFTVSASATAGFTGSIALGCSDIAPATCSFDPATITPGGASTLTVGNLNQVTSTSLSFAVTGTIAQTYSPLTSTSGTASTTNGTTTATLPLTVNFEDFTISASPSQDSIGAGQTASYTLTLAPVNGFNLPVELACAGAPPQATCTLSPSSVNMDGSTPAKVTLQLATTARSLVEPPPGVWLFPWGSRCLWLFGLWGWCVLATLARFGTRKRQSGTWSPIRGAGLMVLVCLLTASCGGGAGGGGVGAAPAPKEQGTPAGTYTLTITATAKSLSHSGTVTLRVN